MRCPDDGKDLAFETFDMNGRIVPFHTCPACSGSFVAGEDLAKFATDARITVSWENGAAKPRDRWRHCPTCVKGLAELTLKGVQLDVCGNCHGVWFDHGELGKLKKKGKRDLFDMRGAGPSLGYIGTYAGLAAALAAAFAAARIRRT